MSFNLLQIFVLVLYNSNTSYYYLSSVRRYYEQERVAHTKLPGIPMSAESREELFDVEEAVKTWEVPQQVG